ncbi:MAG: hypothetical protein L3J32_02185 [Rhizobiaceae bacterium]|nr:hypothetical protein [Rhizobiaceae bacterium]
MTGATTGWIVRILMGPPVWVWPLLAGLLILGLRASKTRRVPIILIYLLPLLGLISINAVVGLERQLIAWIVYFAAYGIGVFAGFAKQAKWLLAKESGRVRLAGEWITLSAMMTIFWVNFIVGTVGAVNPQLLSNAGFIAVSVGLIACASGSFLGRALRVYWTRESRAETPRAR